MSVVSKRLMLINTLGTLGYLSLLFQWLWAVIIVGYPILSSDIPFFHPDSPTQLKPQAIDFGAFSPVMTIVGLAIAAIVLCATVYTILKLPKTVGQQGSKITHKTAAVILPRVIHRRKLSKKKRIRLSYRIMLCIKLLLTVTPALALLFTPSTTGLSTGIVYIIGCFGLVMTVVYFGLQIIMVAILKTDRLKVW